jgi:lysophospholipase L1-like esterase
MASIVVNLAAVFGLVNVVRDRGGVAYLKAYFRKDPNANVDHAAVVRADMFRVLPPPGSQAIVFLGDSLTAGCEWRELFGHRLTILNRGIGGDTSAGVLKRVSGVAALRPVAVFLMIGTNDGQLLGYSPADTLHNYRLIIQELRQSSPGTRIYAESILPSRVPKFNKWSEEVNRGLRQLADGASVTFVDLRPVFLDSDGALNERYTFDGIHLNGEGYLLWRRQIDPLVQDLIRHGEVEDRQP